MHARSGKETRNSISDFTKKTCLFAKNSFVEICGFSKAKFLWKGMNQFYPQILVNNRVDCVL